MNFVVKFTKLRMFVCFGFSRKLTNLWMSNLWMETVCNVQFECINEPCRLAWSSAAAASKCNTKVREHRGQDFCSSLMEEFEIGFALRDSPMEHKFAFLLQPTFHCI